MISGIGSLYPRSRLAKTLSIAAVVTSCFSTTKSAAAQPVQPKTEIGINGIKFRADRPISCGYEVLNICCGTLAERAFIGGRWYRADTEVYSNRYRKFLQGILDEGTLDEDVRILGHDFHAGERVYYDDASGYPIGGKLSTQGFKALFPNISLSEGFDPEMTYRTAGYLSNLTPTMREQIRGINLHSTLPLEIKNGGGYAESPGNIHLLFNFLSQESIAHEAAHLLMFNLKNKLGNNFEGKWVDIAGDVYNKYIDGEKDGMPIWNEGSDDERSSPRHGCIEPYGDKNIKEDVATYGGKIYSKIDMFMPLVDPSSPGYDWRYPAKINLLHEYGFITDKQYHAIIKPDQEQIGRQDHSSLYYAVKSSLWSLLLKDVVLGFIGGLIIWALHQVAKKYMELKNRGN